MPFTRVVRASCAISSLGLSFRFVKGNAVAGHGRHAPITSTIVVNVTPMTEVSIHLAVKAQRGSTWTFHPLRIMWGPVAVCGCRVSLKRPYSSPRSVFSQHLLFFELDRGHQYQIIYVIVGWVLSVCYGRREVLELKIFSVIFQASDMLHPGDTACLSYG